MRKKLLTLDDLCNYYFSKNRSCHFSSKDENKNIVVQVNGNVRFEDTNNDTEGLRKVVLQSCHIGKNLNGSNISRENMENALPSFSNRPILGYIHMITDDNGEEIPHFAGHNIHIENGKVVYDEVPVGVIPESCDARIEYDEDKKKDYVVVNGYLYEEYSDAVEILEREEECSVSVELSIRELTYNAKEKVINLEDFFFSGVTILGVDEETYEEVKPGMGGSNIKLSDFNKKNNSVVYSSSKDTNEKLIETLEKLNNTLSNFNIDENLKEGGKPRLSLKELLKKYNLKETDITFDYKNLSDSELEEKFKEVFGKDSASASSSLNFDGEGESEGGNETGGDTTGNETGGEQTGETTGGEQTGGEQTGSEGGETTGGETTGGETGGGETGGEQGTGAEEQGNSGSGEQTGGQDSGEQGSGQTSDTGNDDDQDDDDDDPEDEFISSDDDSTSKSKKKKKYSEDGSVSILFEISHEDIRSGLYSLLAPVEEDDNDWYFIQNVYDNHFIYCGLFSGNIFAQKYSIDNDTISFVEERWQLFEELLTASEKEELEKMRSNYSLLVDKLNKYESEPEKIELLKSKDYSFISETEEFLSLSKKENYFNLTVEELKNKADEILLKYAKNGSFSFSTQGESKGYKHLPRTEKSSKKGRYGNLFNKNK